METTGNMLVFNNEKVKKKREFVVVSLHSGIMIFHNVCSLFKAKYTCDTYHRQLKMQKAKPLTHILLNPIYFITYTIFESD